MARDTSESCQQTCCEISIILLSNPFNNCVKFVLMDYYVQPQHLYSHSRTCTRSGLCRRPSRLVASLICYLLDHASVHEISALVTWFQYMSNISSHYRDLDPLYIFNLHGDHNPLYIFIMEFLSYLYCMWRWPHMSYFVLCLFMAIVLLCIRDCYIYL